MGSTSTSIGSSVRVVVIGSSSGSSSRACSISSRLCIAVVYKVVSIQL